MEKTVQDIIIVKQYPIVEEQFIALKSQIEEKLSIVQSLEVSEESKAEAKKMRAEFNKDYAYLTGQLKKAKDEITAPYIKLEKLFKEYISPLYAEADKGLKEKIEKIDDEQKRIKIFALEEYFNEYRQSLGLTFPEYSKANFRVGLTSTLKNLREQAKKLLDDVYNSVQSIITLEYSDEVLAEYKENLNLSVSVQIVHQRHENLKKAEKEKEQMTVFKQQNMLVEKKVDKVIIPCEVPSDEVKQLGFRIKAKISKLKEIKEYLIKLERNGEIEIL